ncbi:MAG: serine/threonine-protein kinase [Solirubrobacteraceae bacterium]
MSRTFDVGDEIAGYKIESKVGEGGMGVVFRARHDFLEREAAVKVLGAWLQGNPRARERFVRESRLAATLDHPNIVTVYDAGEAEDTAYIAMQFVTGRDLHDVLVEEGPLDAARALDVLDQVAAALDAAHAAGLVHRDVKPSNVLMDGDKAYLTDFGLTRRFEEDKGITYAGEFMGTIEWAAPEQIDHGDLSARTDVYALGCLLYAMLTARQPYVGESPSEVLFAHLKEPAPKVSEHRSDLPGDVQPVIDRAMAKDPADRFASAGELAAAARAAMGIAAPGSASPPLVPPPSPRRRRLGLIAAAAAGFIAAIAVVVIIVASGGEKTAATTTASTVAKPLTPAQYEDATGAALVKLNQEADALEKRGGATGSTDAVIERFIQLQAAVSQAGEDLAALDPPPEVRNDHEQLVDGYKRLAVEIGDAVQDAQNGDPKALKRESQRLATESSASLKQITRASNAIQQALPG